MLNYNSGLSIPMGKILDCGISLKEFCRSLTDWTKMEIDLSNLKIPTDGAFVYIHFSITSQKTQ